MHSGRPSYSRNLVHYGNKNVMCPGAHDVVETGEIAFVKHVALGCSREQPRRHKVPANSRPRGRRDDHNL